MKVTKQTPKSSYYEGSELAGLQLALNYYAWIIDEFRPFLHGRCLEVGGGEGTFSRLLADTAIESLHTIEPADNLVPSLRAALSQLPQKSAEVTQATIEEFAATAAKPFACVVCLNVLEHIEDDRAAVARMAQLLLPEGYLCLFTPAMPWLYGTLDASFGHRRRYTKHSLIDKVASAGMVVDKLRYFNMAGVVTWLLMGKVLGWRTWGESPVAMYDRLVIPFLRRIEARITPPLGQSLLLVAHKRG